MAVQQGSQDSQPVFMPCSIRDLAARTTPIDPQVMKKPQANPQFLLPSVIVGFLTSAGFGQALTPNYCCEADWVRQVDHDSSHQGWALDGEGSWTGSSNLLTGGGGKWEGTEQTANAYNYVELLALPTSTPCDWEPEFQIRGEEMGDRFSHSLAFVGDLDDDGFDDFVVGAPRAPMNLSASSPAKLGYERGKAYVFLSTDTCLGTELGNWTTGGPAIGAEHASLILEMPEDILVEGVPHDTDGFRFGYAIASAGDYDGDGTSDVAISAPGGGSLSSASGWGGRVYVLSGAAIVDQWEALVTAAGGTCTTGKRVHVETPHHPGTPPAVSIPVLSGTIQFDPLSDQYGVPGQARYGHSLAYGGTALGFGYESLVIGAPQFEQTPIDVLGLKHKTFGPGFVDVVRLPDASTPTFSHSRRVYGGRCASEFGYDVDAAADLNGDGQSELLVGAPGWNNTQQAWSPTFTCSVIDTTPQDVVGRAYVLDISIPPVPGGPASHYFPVIQAHNQPFFTPSSPGGRFGFHVGFVGSLRGDAREEYVIGSPFFTSRSIGGACDAVPCTVDTNTDGGGGQAGAAYVYDGSLSSTSPYVMYYGEDARDGFGWDSTRIGEATESQPGYVAISAPRWGVDGVPGKKEVGRTYLFLGL